MSAVTSVAALFYFREREVKLWQIWEQRKRQNCGVFPKNKYKSFAAKMLVQMCESHRTRKEVHTTYLKTIQILLHRKNKTVN